MRKVVKIKKEQLQDDNDNDEDADVSMLADNEFDIDEEKKQVEQVGSSSSSKAAMPFWEIWVQRTHSSLLLWMKSSSMSKLSMRRCGF